MSKLNKYYKRKMKRSEKMMGITVKFIGLLILISLLIYLIDFVI